VNAEGLTRLESAVQVHGFDPVPSVGNFLYVDTGSDATDLYERLLREGIIVRPLAGFGSTTAIRVSVGTPDEIDAFAAALDRVLARA
jgi:histidinol-phosphate aminotransferase